jgi:hypothetical protein
LDIINGNTVQSREHAEDSSIAPRTDLNGLSDEDHALVENSSIPGQHCPSIRSDSSEEQHSPFQSAKKNVNSSNLDDVHEGDTFTAAVQPRARNTATWKDKNESNTRVPSYLSCDIIAELAHQTSQQADLLLQRSLFFCLSDPSVLVRSFWEGEGDQPSSSPLSYLDPTRESRLELGKQEGAYLHAMRVIESFQSISKHKALICDSLCEALQALFTPPPEVAAQNSSASHTRRSSNLITVSPYPIAEQKSTTTNYLNDIDALHIIVVCIYALTSLPTSRNPEAWVKLRRARRWGAVWPSFRDPTLWPVGVATAVSNLVDAYEYEPAIRLADKLVRAVAARGRFAAMQDDLSSSRENDTGAPLDPHFGLLDLLMLHLTTIDSHSNLPDYIGPEDDKIMAGWSLNSSLLDWLQTIVLKRWDGNSEFSKSSSIGAALELMYKIYDHRGYSSFLPSMFYMPHLTEHIDSLRIPADFLARSDVDAGSDDINTVHLLRFHMLFPIRTQVRYFRALNHAAMYKQVELARTARELKTKFEKTFYPGQAIPNTNPLSGLQFEETMREYLVLSVRREHALEDTVNTLWGLQRHEFLKPLKVNFHNEAGHDQGGLSTEFFQKILDDAVNPDHGMFTVVNETYRWFQPGSLEPAWKFEMVGALISLAVYNGIAIPVHFPLALYAQLLYIREYSEFVIRDAWPERAEWYEKLRRDTENAVHWGLTYDFSFDAFGYQVTVDTKMFADDDLWPADDEDQIEESRAGIWPDNVPLPPMDSTAWTRPRLRSGPEKDFDPVTNENKEKYVRDWIFWLMNKSIRPQLSAFRKGFFTCIDFDAVSIFRSPERLQAVVEGTPIFSITTLKNGTSYDGYSKTDANIQDFWSIVSEYEPAQVKKLVEFTTGRDRLPVAADHIWTIARQGTDDHLPSASTCALTLNLPNYENKEKMAQKLQLALTLGEGFHMI